MNRCTTCRAELFLPPYGYDLDDHSVHPMDLHLYLNTLFLAPSRDSIIWRWPLLDPAQLTIYAHSMTNRLLEIMGQVADRLHSSGAKASWQQAEKETIRGIVRDVPKTPHSPGHPHALGHR